MCYLKKDTGVTGLLKQAISHLFETCLGTKLSYQEISGTERKPQAATCLSAVMLTQSGSLRLQYICRTKTSTVLYSALSLFVWHTHTHTQSVSGRSVDLSFYALHRQKVKKSIEKFLFLYLFFFHLSFMAHMFKIKWAELILYETRFNGFPLAVFDILEFKSGLSSPLISDKEKKKTGF